MTSRPVSSSIQSEGQTRANKTRQAAYFLVLLMAFILQVVSIVLHASDGYSGYSVVGVVRFLSGLLCLVMMVLVALRFRPTVIHNLGLLLAFAWVLIDVSYSWQTQHNLSIDALLETNILALLAFAFWPAPAASALMTAVFSGLFSLTVQFDIQQIVSVLLTGFTILLTGFMSIYGRRISIAQARNDALGELAFRDSLTGLANRHMADAMLARLSTCPNPERVAVILFDIDHFKRVNDTMGHQAGDEALRHISGVLQHFVRATDLLARWGGEEFLLVWYGIDPQKAQERTEEILQAVRNAPLADFPPLTLSCGGVMFGQVSSVPAALALADARLYRAKAQGRNQAVWE